MMDMSSTMSSGMSMPTSSSSMSSGNMSGMSSDGGMMSMSSMMMVFFTASNTPLYSSSWTPNTSGQYVGTCIFLIALAALFRGIVAVRSNFPELLAWYTLRRDTGLLRVDDEHDGKRSAMLSSRSRPWNINEALARAILDTILAGVSYLLMLAVMTMNVGYFLSILGGTFLGSLVIGDWAADAALHCDAH